MKLWVVFNAITIDEHSGEEVEVAKTTATYHYLKDRPLRVRIENGCVTNRFGLGPQLGTAFRDRQAYIEQSRLGKTWVLIRRSFTAYVGSNYNVPPHMTYEMALRIARDLRIEVNL